MLVHFRKLHRKLVARRRKTHTLASLGPAHFEHLDIFFEQRTFAPISVTRQTAPSQVVVIGDLHADFPLFLALLANSGCINAEGHWTGKTTVVVQVGDFLDGGGRTDVDGNLVSVVTENCREEIDIMQYAWFLDQEARQVGGGVVLLSGNHEYMNFVHDFACTSKETNLGWGGIKERAAWFTRGSRFATDYFQMRHPAMLSLGPLIFVHGGPGRNCDPNGFSETFETYLTTVNAEWFAFLTGHGEDISPCVRDALFSRVISNQFRGTTSQCQSVGQTFLEEIGLSPDAIVCVGHTPQIEGYQPQSKINGVCGPRMWRVDVGGSKAFGNNERGQCLVITKEVGGPFEFEVVDAN